MRKLITGLFMSVDGVIEADDEWQFPYFDDELIGKLMDQMRRADAVLMGRRTYEGYAAIWSDGPSDTPMARFLDAAPKHVVTSTLTSFSWHNSTALGGDLETEIRELKRSPGRDILIPGSPTLIRWLLGRGLLDELAYTVLPVVVGRGPRLFDRMPAVEIGLELARSKPLASGALELSYVPA